MKSLKDCAQDINFNFPKEYDEYPCISVWGFGDRIVLWVHFKRIEIKASDLLSTKTLMLLNAHAYDFVKYMEKFEEI